MTPLEYLATNPSAAEAKLKFLIFSVELRDAMLAKQDTLTTNHHISPVLLTDGRYGACCDLLTEVGVGGIYHALFSILDLDALNTALLVDKPEFMALLPVNDGD